MVNIKFCIGVLGRDKMLEIVKNFSNNSNYAKFQFIFFKNMFDQAFKEINKVIDNIDIFISGHTHFKLLNFWFPNKPHVLIRPLPFDIMLTIREAAKFDKMVYLINLYKSIEFEQIKEIVRSDIQIYQYNFSNTDYLKYILSLIKQNGGKVVVGGSLVCDIATDYGLKPFYYYSEQAVEQALKEAVNLLLIKADLKRSNEKLKKVVDLSNVGIVLLNKDQKIEYINRMAIKILNLPNSDFTGLPLEKVLPNFELINTEVENMICKINGEEVLVDIVNSNDGGLIYRFQEIKRVEKASMEIRKHMFPKPQTAKYNFHDILGGCLQPTIEIAKSYAVSSNADILITGPTGSGKELFASSIHNISSRSGEPFIPVNCAALPENLLESELFGYEPGAFTGAKKQGKRGLIELAHKGTLFLDEIGEMPYALQAKLLRVLQEKEVLRVGGEFLVPVDIRVIAATNRKLEECVANNTFRADLYYRLSTLVLEIPPLSKRQSDIEEIMNHFFVSQNIPSLTQDVIKGVIKEVYKDYEWPGNVRELLNVLERVVTYLRYTKKYELPVKELIKDLRNLLKGGSKREQLLSSLNITNATQNFIYYEGYKGSIKVNKHTIESALNVTGGNKTKAAKLLGISRSTLWRLLKNSEIKEPIN